jgi:cation diffusion facilitator family transporter
MTNDTARDYRKSIKIALCITFIFFLVEIVGGLHSGSLALISDAGYLFSDLLSLILSLGAMTFALQLSSKERTYGYHRGEILAAFINSLLLIGVSAGILWEAYQRLLNPAPVQGGVRSYSVGVCNSTHSQTDAYCMSSNHAGKLSGSFPSVFLFSGMPKTLRCRSRSIH